MNTPPVILPETREYLLLLRSFFVMTCATIPRSGERISAHTKVIKPLLASATEAFVWPPKNKQQPATYPPEILIPERGRHRFDLSRDVLTDFESFWNEAAGARGSIALRLSHLPNNIVEIFMHCHCPQSAVFASRHQLKKSESSGAIRYCDQVVDNGDYAFLFSATNGIQLLSVFAPGFDLERTYRLALEFGRPFKRWFECAPGESVNLI